MRGVKFINLDSMLLINMVDIHLKMRNTMTGQSFSRANP